MSTLLSNYNMQRKLEYVNCCRYKKNKTMPLFAGNVYADVECDSRRLIL